MVTFNLCSNQRLSAVVIDSTAAAAAAAAGDGLDDSSVTSETAA